MRWYSMAGMMPMSAVLASHRVRAMRRCGELEFVFPALRAGQHAPDQRDAIQILDDGDSEI